MKKQLLIIFGILLFSINFAKAQTIKDTIQIRKSTFGTIYLKDGKSLNTGRKLHKLIKSNPENYSEITIIKTNWVFATIFGGAAGYIYGNQYATRYRRSSPDWVSLSAATALFGLSIPFEIGRAKHIKKAVLIYNKGLMETSKNKTLYNFGISNNGIGVKIAF
ncbi:hypothetical protein A5893_16425 [Pedobacter psychrophilus]|uniref:Uncharacterized protein n=1 Tax=Pedobacter psychrophilus TaxID=1826909 RepID=A0A179DA84_9SPHI|nr:hypothetical protein [Pedobacter psychrophilus]OAQ37955.1 hypothetical protein A5893_16425 [Pedobacter psychrophilus]